MSRKGYDRIPWSPVILRIQVSFFCVWNNFWFRCQLRSLWAVMPCLLYLRYDVFTLYSFWVSLNSQVFWVFWTSVFLGHWDIVCNGKEGWTRTSHLSPPLICLLHGPSGWKRLCISNCGDCECWTSGFCGCVLEEMNQIWVHAQLGLTYFLLPSFF